METETDGALPPGTESEADTIPDGGSAGEGTGIGIESDAEIIPVCSETAPTRRELVVGR